MFSLLSTRSPFGQKGPRPPVPITENIVASYDYFADGAKFSLTDANGLTRLYLGPFTLARKKKGTPLS